MNMLFALVAQFLRCLALLGGNGGARALIAEILLLKQQLLILNRGRKRAPSVSPVNKLLLAFWCLWLRQRWLAVLFD